MTTSNQNRVTIINVLSTVVLQGVAFFSTPIFTRMLGTEIYGQYATFHSWVLIITCFIGLSLDASLGTALYEFKNQFKQYCSSTLLLALTVSGSILLGALIFHKQFEFILGYNSEVLVILLLTAISSFILKYAQSIFIYEKRAGINLLVSSFTALSTVGLSYYFILSFYNNDKFFGRVLGNLIPYAVVSIILVIAIVAREKTRIKKDYSKYALYISIPIIFHSLANCILAQSDRVMMGQQGIADADIGVYSFFYTLVSVLGSVLSALNISWCPFYYDDLSKENYKSIEEKSKHYIELFSVICSVFVLLSYEVALLLADETYMYGYNLIVILVFTYFFMFMYQFFVNYEFFYKKTKIVAIGTIGSGLVNILLNYFFIEYIGMYGAALATSFSYFVLFLFHYVIVLRIKKEGFIIRIRWFVKGLLLLGISCFIFCMAKNFWWLRWCFGMLLSLYILIKVLNRKSIF